MHEEQRESMVPRHRGHASLHHGVCCKTKSRLRAFNLHFEEPLEITRYRRLVLGHGAWFLYKTTFQELNLRVLAENGPLDDCMTTTG